MDTRLIDTEHTTVPVGALNRLCELKNIQIVKLVNFPVLPETKICLNNKTRSNKLIPYRKSSPRKGLCTFTYLGL